MNKLLVLVRIMIKITLDDRYSQFLFIACHVLQLWSNGVSSDLFWITKANQQTTGICKNNDKNNPAQSKFPNFCSLHAIFSNTEVSVIGLRLCQNKLNEFKHKKVYVYNTFKMKVKSWLLKNCEVKILARFCSIIGKIYPNLPN